MNGCAGPKLEDVHSQEASTYVVEMPSVSARCMGQEVKPHIAQNPKNIVIDP